MNKLTLIVFLSLFLNACSFSDHISALSLTPYKADVNQGSALSRFHINQLKTGMSKKQVQELIGSPSVIDPFHNNQWDYIHHSTMGLGKTIHHHLALKFKGRELVNIDTDGIAYLPPLTSKQKILEKKRIAEEKAKVKARAEAIIKAKALEVQRVAEEKAKAKAEAEAITKAKALEAQRVAEEKAKTKAKAKAEAIIKAKALEAQRIAEEKAKAKARTEAIIKAKALEAQRVAEEKAKALAAKKLKESEPWYKFW